MPNTAIVSTLRLFVALPSDCDNERGVQRFTSTSICEKGNSDIAKMMNSRQSDFYLTKITLIHQILFENNLISPLAMGCDNERVDQRYRCEGTWPLYFFLNVSLDLSGGYPFRLRLLHPKFWEPLLKGGGHFIFMIFGPFSARDFLGMNYDVLILRLAIFHLGDIPIEAT